MLVFLSEEKLTRQPIFNSSAPPLEDESLLQQRLLFLSDVLHSVSVYTVFMCLCDDIVIDCFSVGGSEKSLHDLLLFVETQRQLRYHN